jgi:hypothetical protein
MTIKWNREMALITLMALVVMYAIFHFGYQNFVEPSEIEAENLRADVRSQQSLLDMYPPSEASLAQYIADSKSTETFLPSGDQINIALVRMEELAADANVQLQSVSRSSFQEAVEDVPGQFARNDYSVQMSSASPANFRSLIDALMNEERIWNITSFDYSKSDEGAYAGNLTVSLYYFLGGDESPVEAAEDQQTG